MKTLHTELGVEALTAVTTKGTIFWDKIPCNMAEMHWSFGGNYCLHLQGENVSQAINRQATTKKDKTKLTSYPQIRMNKKFWEELIPYFPWCDTGHIENDASKNSSIVMCVCVTAVTFLPSRCLATTEEFLPSRCLATVGTISSSRCLAKIGQYTRRHTDWWEGLLIRPLRWAQVPWYTYQVS
jgi:hypothetical protein